MANPTEIVKTPSEKIVAQDREIVIICPYEVVSEQIERIITNCRPDVKVHVISELNGIIHLTRDHLDFGDNHSSLRSVDFSGARWNLDKEPHFGEYVERQLNMVGPEMADEMMAGHNPGLVIDLGQLAGVWGDIIGVYNIHAFEN